MAEHPSPKKINLFNDGWNIKTQKAEGYQLLSVIECSDIHPVRQGVLTPQQPSINKSSRPELTTESRNTKTTISLMVGTPKTSLLGPLDP